MEFAVSTHAAAHAPLSLPYCDGAVDALLAAADSTEVCGSTVEMLQRWSLPSVVGNPSTKYEVWPVHNNDKRLTRLVLGCHGPDVIERMTVSFRGVSAGSPVVGRRSEGHLHPNEPAPENDWPHPSVGELHDVGDHVEMRVLPTVYEGHTESFRRSRMWIRFRNELPDCAFTHASALVFAVSRIYGDRAARVWCGPVRQVLHVHDSFRADDWLRCERWSDAPGSTDLRIWSAMGRLVATSSHVMLDSGIQVDAPVVEAGGLEHGVLATG